MKLSREYDVYVYHNLYLLIRPKQFAGNSTVPCGCTTMSKLPTACKAFFQARLCSLTLGLGVIAADPLLTTLHNCSNHFQGHLEGFSQTY